MDSLSTCEITFNAFPCKSYFPAFWSMLFMLLSHNFSLSLFPSALKQSDEYVVT